MIHRDKETSSRSTLKTNSTGQACIRTHLSTCSDDNFNTNHKSAYYTVKARVYKVKSAIHVDVSGQRGEEIETIRLSWERTKE